MSVEFDQLQPIPAGQLPWFTEGSANTQKTNANFEKAKAKFEEIDGQMSKTIISATEPPDMDENTCWLQDIGDSPDFGVVGTAGIAFVNVADSEPDEDGYYFEEAPSNSVNGKIII